MAENEISDYLEVDNDNVDIHGITVQENVMKPSNVNNAFRAVQGALKRWFKTSLFRLRDSTDQTKLLAFDLSGLTPGTRTLTVQDKDGTIALTSDTAQLATKVDTRRNRVVNGDMRVSQENGTTSGTTSGRYGVDQWAQYFVTSAGTLTIAQVAAVTPAGSPNRLRGTVTVADATLAAGEFWTLTQNLEGSNVADFQYGGASAKASVLRFGFKGPAGTYAARIGNSAANRSFVALFTITAPQANTDTVQTIAISGDVTGTWLTADGVIGITLEIVLACGSTFRGVAGWQSGLILGTSAVSNGMATGSAVFELFDVGLKLDPDATGVYGAYEVGVVDPVYRPERYLFNAKGDEPFPGVGQLTATNTLLWNVGHLVKMAKPTVLLSFSNIVHSLPNGTFFAVSNIVLAAGGVLATRLTVTSSQTGFTAGTASIFGGSTSNGSLLLSARL